MGEEQTDEIQSVNSSSPTTVDEKTVSGHLIPDKT